ASIFDARSRVSCSRSHRSPNSGEMMILNSRGSPAVCQRRRVAEMSDTDPDGPNATAVPALLCIALSRERYRPWAAHWPALRLGEYVRRTAQRCWWECGAGDRLDFEHRLDIRA